jgi:PadR family transcriptional regulator, regulatory protein PadR
MITSTPMERLKNKLTVECLWPYILSLMRDEAVYAYEIQDKLREKYDFEVGNVTSYMVLYKLEASNLVKTEWRNVDNRQRKYYSLTPEGHKSLNDAINTFQNITEQLKK